MGKRKRPARGDDNDVDVEVTFRCPKKARFDAPGPQQTAPAPTPPPRRSPNGFLLPDPLPKATIVRDNSGGLWRIGNAIGLGGFGEIYAAASLQKGARRSQDFVVKVEPHSNGPLFVEIAFYLNSCRSDQLEQWRSHRGLRHLGVAKFVASGSLFINGKKLRFLVLPRYGVDLQTELDRVGPRAFSTGTACSLASQVIDSLEYIHSKGYVHKDIKGSNILFDRKSKKKIYLVDFGLCNKFCPGGLHRPNEPDNRWAHEGTEEYTSRDSHRGCFSRRGDLEVTLYNLIEWLGGRLPWDHEDEDRKNEEMNVQRRHRQASIVREEKETAFKMKRKFLASCFPGRSYPRFLMSLMEVIEDTSFEEEPGYQLFKDILNAQIVSEDNISDENVEPVKTKLRRSKRTKRSPRREVAKHLSPEKYEGVRKEKMRQRCEESLKNPTPAMLQQLDKMRARPEFVTPKERSGRWRNVMPSPYTPAMEEVMRLRTSQGRHHTTKAASVSPRDRVRSPQSLQRRKVKGKATPDSVPRLRSPGQHRVASERQRLLRSRNISGLQSNKTASQQPTIRTQVSQMVDAGLGIIRGISRNLFPGFSK